MDTKINLTPTNSLRCITSEQSILWVRTFSFPSHISPISSEAMKNITLLTSLLRKSSPFLINLFSLSPCLRSMTKSMRKDKTILQRRKNVRKTISTISRFLERKRNKKIPQSKIQMQIGRRSLGMRSNQAISLPLINLVEEELQNRRSENFKRCKSNERINR